MLGLFVSTLTADEKYHFLIRDDLTQPIQMQLSEKEKTCSECFSTFLEFRWNFKHYPTTDDLHNLCTSEITGCERRG